MAVVVALLEAAWMVHFLLIHFLFAVGRVFDGRVGVKNKVGRKDKLGKAAHSPQNQNKTHQNTEQQAAIAIAMTSKAAIEIAIKIVMAIGFKSN